MNEKHQSPWPPPDANPSVLPGNINACFPLLDFEGPGAEEAPPSDRRKLLEILRKSERCLQFVCPNLGCVAFETARAPLRTERKDDVSLFVCTGVGRGGKGVRLPGYERGRTVIVLMGVARLAAVVATMLSADGGQRGRDGVAYPPYTPIAIIERASMPDQRVVSSTLENIVDALENTGEQRPPGLMVVGWAVSSLWENGEIDVLATGDQAIDAHVEAEGDKARIERWLKGGKWRVSEGFDSLFFEKHLNVSL